MLSNKPYLLRAFYQWIVESDCHPILVIDADHPRAKIPLDFAEGGEIVFNVSPAAIRDLKISNELVEFKASFSGVIHLISAPVKAILAIYAEENGEGIFFDAEEDEAGAGTTDNRGVSDLRAMNNSMAVDDTMDAAIDPVSIQPPPQKGKPFLTLVE